MKADVRTAQLETWGTKKKEQSPFRNKNADRL